MGAGDRKLSQWLTFDVIFAAVTLPVLYYVVREALSRLDPDAGAKAEARQKALAASSRLQSIFSNDDRIGNDAGGNEEEGIREARYDNRPPKQELVLNPYEQTIAIEVVSPNEIPVTFDDIGGLDHIIEELRESVIYPLTMPHLYASHSSLLTAPSGVLLYGPPGCGKTMLAKALARESGACFINLHISTLTEKWFGDSNKLVAAVFSLARKLQPSIVFIDEIDAVLGQRRSGEHEASGMVKAEFMTHWDGLASSTSKDGSQRICVLGATNRVQDIDDAILRRMPKKFPIKLPNKAQRRQIFNVTLRDTQIDRLTFDVNVLVRLSAGMSGSDIKDACRDAAMVPVREYIKAAKANGENVRSGIKEGTVRGLRVEDFFGTAGGARQLEAPAPKAKASLGTARDVRQLEAPEGRAEDAESAHSGSTEEVDDFEDPDEVETKGH